MKKFENVAANAFNPKWNTILSRKQPLYNRGNDIRSDFERDYTRIIHSSAYRRLKHKTQVFFSPESDHICTRIEHVTHVESISYTIANYLGLNTELTKAISVAHDLGHSPFGHEGERILSEISKRDLHCSFWHEKNGLNLVDSIDLLENSDRFKENLNLTYGVRDGIVSHCGEIDENGLKPRNDFIDLNSYSYPNQYAPYTWEGCVVKMSDKIAYLARDIEDALRLNIIDEQLVEDLRNHLNQLTKSHFDAINNGTIVNYFILDVCQNSSIEKGICLSDEAFEVMKYIMKFNYQNIYLIDRIEVHTNYVQLILNSIFQFLYKYDKIANDNQINVLEALKKDQKKYPVTIQGYMHWLEKYSQMKHFNRNPLYQNHIIYDFEHDKNAMAKSIIDYLSGMSDAYILKIFNEFISFS